MSTLTGLLILLGLCLAGCWSYCCQVCCFHRRQDDSENGPVAD